MTVEIKQFKKNYDYSYFRGNADLSPYSSENSAEDIIHFLPTGCSDAILLESDGHFALIDCAEDSDNPRGFEWLNFRGWEDEILTYLKKHASDESGKVRLNFILGTHSHSDHLGGFDTVISDNSVVIERAYLKRYEEEKIRLSEVEKWDNREVYEQTVNALKNKNIPIIEDINETSFKLGNMKITLFNTEYDEENTDIGENDNSLGVLVEAYGKRVFLAGDIDNENGDEERLAPQIGKVDVLKVGHHSYSGSTSEVWLKTLLPDFCIVTNNFEFSDKSTLKRIKKTCSCPTLVTGSEGGIITAFNSDGTLSFYNKLIF